MKQNFEYNNHDDSDRIAILENRAAELERRLLAFAPPDPVTGWRNVVLPGGGRVPEQGAPEQEEPEFAAPEFEAPEFATEGAPDDLEFGETADEPGGRPDG